MTFKKISSLAFIGTLTILLLTGCFYKSSRAFIEGKAAELSLVYPTEDLTDLFDKFPEGFEIISRDLYDYEGGKNRIFQSISLKGDSKLKQIKRTVTEKKISFDQDGKRHEELVYEGEVVYQDGEIRLKEPQADFQIKHPKLLLQQFTLNKDLLKNLSLDGKSYSFETGSADISYNVENKELNRYMGVKENTTLRMIVYIRKNTVDGESFSYTVNIRNENGSHAENIYGGK